MGDLVGLICRLHGPIIGTDSLYIPTRQIFQQTRQINELQDALRQRDAELRDLREVAEAAAELQSADQQAAKIIDLSKKVGRVAGMCGRWGFPACPKPSHWKPMFEAC